MSAAAPRSTRKPRRAAFSGGEHGQREAASAPRRVCVLGVTLDALRMDEVIERVHDAIRTKTPLLIGVINAAKVVNMRRDVQLAASVRSSDIVLADGMAVVWASRLLGRPVPERVAGIDLMLRLFERGSEQGYRIFCLGAKPDTLGRFVERMRRDYPGAAIVGARDGYFSREEEAEVARQIAESKPDILFAAMSSPKKEEFLARWSGTIRTPVCHGVGGSFDVLAGDVRRAPAAWQRFGFEWLFRLLQEPRRLWKRYLVTNTAFCWLVLLALLGRVFGRRRTVRQC